MEIDTPDAGPSKRSPPEAESDEPPKRQRQDGDAETAAVPEKPLSEAAAEILKRAEAAIAAAETTCPVCLNKFTAGNTAMLACFHAVCRGCVPKNEEFTCAVCAAKHTVKDVATLPYHPLVELALAEGSIPRCSECPGDVDDADARASNSCAACGPSVHLCTLHSRLHGLRASTKGHRLEAILLPWLTCAQHRKVYTKWCAKCEATLCEDCTEPHEAKTLEAPDSTGATTIEQKKSAFLKTCKDAVTSLAENSALYAAAAASVTESVADAHKNIDDVAATLHSKIDAAVADYKAVTSKRGDRLREEIVHKGAANTEKILQLYTALGWAARPLFRNLACDIQTGFIVRNANKAISRLKILPAPSTKLVIDVSENATDNLEEALNDVMGIRFAAYGPNCRFEGKKLLCMDFFGNTVTGSGDVVRSGSLEWAPNKDGTYELEGNEDYVSLTVNGTPVFVPSHGINPSNTMVFSPFGLKGKDGPPLSVALLHLGDVSSMITNLRLDGNNNGVFLFSFKRNGRYSIQIAGAGGAHSQVKYTGGQGAVIKGEHIFEVGVTLRLFVGQCGTTDGMSGGGGGASGINIYGSHEPLLIAGGGGGCRMESDANGIDASLERSGMTNSNRMSRLRQPMHSNVAPGGCGENADGNFGIGGAGWHIGGSDTSNLKSRVDGGRRTHAHNACGGFGGGAGPQDESNGDGGGGGGYTGGSGGRLAGGGGSYISDSFENVVKWVDTRGKPGSPADGYIQIAYLGSE